MSDSINWQHKLSRENWQPLKRQTICNDCAFHTKVAEVMQCIHPDEFEVNCSTIIFCNSFQPTQEIESPCVSFGKDDGE
ncbi:hypothetical protein [Calothrix sp. PCC 7507]|uniref:hypothetical protein n=1 Tax=Calothrix sp. PCC 7507 TaxID=99598 RepID=UPI00029F12F5|nr:hypothetical protein [Calothrix sp. PCC 7507]AFY31128.1 hypothetical protein Cal7507_0639 [Calothrix sp. PCC 7507]